MGTITDLLAIIANSFLILLCIISITWLFDKKNKAIETSLAGMIIIVSIFFLSGIIIHLLRLSDFLTFITYSMTVSPFSIFIFIFILIGIFLIFAEKLFIRRK
jgi:hypothetical protein